MLFVIDVVIVVSEMRVLKLEIAKLSLRYLNPLSIPYLHRAM